MSINKIGVCPVTTNNVSNTVDYLHDGSSITTRYLVWNSDSGSDVHKSFEFQITFIGLIKGKNIETRESSTFTATIPVAKCNEHTSPYGSGVFWAVSLSQIEGLLENLTNGDTGANLTYGKRKYDRLKLNVSIRANFIQDWWGTGLNSPWENQQIELVYVPQLTIDKLYYEESDLVVIEYSTPGWSRDDDRWQLNYIRGAEGAFYNATRYLVDEDNTWGSCVKQGRIQISTDLLQYSMMNKNVRIQLRIVPSYMPTGQTNYFATTTRTITVENETARNTPTIERKNSDNNSIEFALGDSGDKGKPINQITVKIEGGLYQCDQVTVYQNEDGTFPNVVFRYIPFNTPVYFTAIGSNDKDVSEPKTIGSFTLSNRNRTVFDSLINGTHVELVDDVQTSIEDRNNQTLVQMAGKRRPSAFYGAGGTTNLSFSATMLFDDANQFLSLADSNETFVGDVMVRLPDGRRYAMAVDSAKADWTLRNQKTVTINGQEVSA